MFLSNGDFSFPLYVSKYLEKHFYIWNELNGSINYDGIIRFFGRLPYEALFILTNNIFVSYVYIFSILLVLLSSFYFFQRHFFHVQKKSVAILLSLFVVFSPAVLGNVSKTGLILGVAMLPFGLVLASKFLKEFRAIYLLLIVLILNISLIHPFIFSVNALIIAGYLVYQLLQRKCLLSRRVLVSLFGTVIFFLAIHAYIFVPLISNFTLDKSSLSSNISNDVVVYEDLIDIANTGNMLNSLTLKKDVLMDFDFYDQDTEFIYYISQLCIIIVLTILYIAQMGMPLSGFRMTIFFMIFLAMLAISATYTDVLKESMRWIVSKPVGWIFRSPLKWQMYAPIFLYAALATSLYGFFKNRVRYILTILFVSVSLGSAYIATDIYDRLLTPKSFHYFQGNLAEVSGNLLSISNTCKEDRDILIGVSEEFNQVTLSSNVSVFNIQSRNITNTPYMYFDYIYGCDLNLGQIHLFTEHKLSDHISLYKRKENGLIKRGDIYTLAKINAIDTNKDIEAFYRFLSKSGNSTDFVPGVFSNAQLNTEYTRTPFDSSMNLIMNPSFEVGLWQNEVGDCYSYDTNPVLSMLRSKDSTNGKYSLELHATRHNACTSQQNISINAGKEYILSFEYKGVFSKKASFSLRFNDSIKSVVSDTFSINDENWHTYERRFSAPPSVTRVELIVYTHQGDLSTENIVRYDNFSLYELPSIEEQYKMVLDSIVYRRVSQSITFDLINPTKKLVHIQGATTPFFLAMSESYHDKWQLQFNNAQVHGWLNGWWPFAKPNRVGDEYHYKLDGFLNAWYVDTHELCEVQHIAGCTKNADGSYDIEMVIEFWPQRWFYLGLLISGTTLAGCLTYLGYVLVRKVRRKLRGGTWSEEGESVQLDGGEYAVSESVSDPVLDVQMHNARDVFSFMVAVLMRGVDDVRKWPLRAGVALAVGIGSGLWWGADSGLLWALFAFFFVYRWDSRVPGVLAILTLTSCPILLALKLDTAAEQTAVYAYLFLVMTVVLQIIEYWRERKVSRRCGGDRS